MTPAAAARLLIVRHADEIQAALDAGDGGRMAALMEVPVKLWLEGIAAEDGPLQERILAALAQANALTAGEIARDINAHRDVVQTALNDFQEGERVLMRNGFYRLSEAEKVRRGMKREA